MAVDANTAKGHGEKRRAGDSRKAMSSKGRTVSVGHDEYSKDNPKKSDESKLRVNGKTKYRIAYDLAIDLSEQILWNLKDDLGSDGWSRVAETFD